MNIQTKVIDNKGHANGHVVLEVDPYPSTNTKLHGKGIKVSIFTMVNECLAPIEGNLTLYTANSSVVPDPEILGIVIQCCAGCRFIPRKPSEEGKCNAYYKR